MGAKKETTLNVSITSGTVYKTILVLVLFYFLYTFRDLVIILLTAVVIASAIEPATRWFGRFRVPRTPAVIAVYVLIAGLFTSIFFVFVPLIVDEAVRIDQIYNVSAMLSEYISEGPALLESTAQGEEVRSSFTFREMLANLKASVTGDPEEAFRTISAIFGGVLSFILIIVMSFYLAVQERGIEEFLKIITPIKHQKYVVDLWERSQMKIGLWMQGQLLLGVLIGVLVYLGLSILGVQYALLLALLAAFAELIPIFGPILAAIPAVMISFVNGVYFADPGLAAGIIVALFYVIIQQFENHLIYPMVVRKVVGVSPLIVIIAIIIGVKLAGFLGVLLAVPVSAAIMEFTNDIQKEKHIT